jgi:PHD/YefM family antitoxin component YafN of YafNO toxin-antitoxin module
MKTLTVTETRKNIYNLLKEINETSEPIQIIGKNCNGILISEKDWNALLETLYLLPISKSIIKGLNTQLEDCEEFDMNSLLEDDKNV